MFFPFLAYLTQVKISSPEIQDALYDLILDMSYGHTDVVITLITQAKKTTRLVFLKAAGDLMLIDAAGALEKIIAVESDKEILVAAINALGCLRRPESLNTLSPALSLPGARCQAGRHPGHFRNSRPGCRGSAHRIQWVMMNL